MFLVPEGRGISLFLGMRILYIKKGKKWIEENS